MADDPDYQPDDHKLEKSEKPRYSIPRQLTNWSEENKEKAMTCFHQFTRTQNQMPALCKFMSEHIGCTIGAAQQFLEKNSRDWWADGELLEQRNPSSKKKKGTPAQIDILDVDEIDSKDDHVPTPTPKSSSFDDKPTKQGRGRSTRNKKGRNPPKTARKSARNGGRAAKDGTFNAAKDKKGPHVVPSLPPADMTLRAAPLISQNSAVSGNTGLDLPPYPFEGGSHPSFSSFFPNRAVQDFTSAAGNQIGTKRAAAPDSSFHPLDRMNSFVKHESQTPSKKQKVNIKEETSPIKKHYLGSVPFCPGKPLGPPPKSPQFLNGQHNRMPPIPMTQMSPYNSSISTLMSQHSLGGSGSMGSMSQQHGNTFANPLFNPTLNHLPKIDGGSNFGGFNIHQNSQLGHTSFGGSSFTGTFMGAVDPQYYGAGPRVPSCEDFNASLLTGMSSSAPAALGSPFTSVPNPSLGEGFQMPQKLHWSESAASSESDTFFPQTSPPGSLLPLEFPKINSPVSLCATIPESQQSFHTSDREVSSTDISEVAPDYQEMHKYASPADLLGPAAPASPVAFAETAAVDSTPLNPSAVSAEDSSPDLDDLSAFDFDFVKLAGETKDFGTLMTGCNNPLLSDWPMDGTFEDMSPGDMLAEFDNI